MRGRSYLHPLAEASAQLTWLGRMAERPEGVAAGTARLDNRKSKATFGQKPRMLDRAEVEEVREQRAQLVAGPVRLRGDPPAVAEFLALVEAEDRLRVTWESCVQARFDRPGASVDHGVKSTVCDHVRGQKRARRDAAHRSLR